MKIPMYRIFENEQKPRIAYRVYGIVALFAVVPLALATPPKVVMFPGLLACALCTASLNVYMRYWTRRSNRVFRNNLVVWNALIHAAAFTLYAWVLVIRFGGRSERFLALLGYALISLLIACLLAFLILVTAELVGWFAEAVLKNLRAFLGPQHCRECGYDLTGNVSGRCPECGTPTETWPTRTRE
jgi:hypothetical protein